MAEVTNALMYELPKKMHRLEHGLGEVMHEIVAIRLQALGTQTDINNSVTARIDQRLERIEDRLELRELAEAQKPYEPK